MRMVVQRVLKAALASEGVPAGSMQAGLLVLVGIEPSDADERCFAYMADKITHLRIFKDDQDKMNLSVEDIGGSLLLVSNFTLYGDARHGRRPGYTDGADPETARRVFEDFVAFCRKESPVPVLEGVFQTHMQIDVSLDGPVTILLDSDKVF